MAQSRAPSSLWAQLVLRTVSAILLVVSLGYLIYCSAKFSEHLVAGYVVDLILLVFNLSVLIRVCTTIFGSISTPGRFEAGCMSFADIVGVLLSIFGGIYLILAYGQNRECGTDKCDALRSYPTGECRDTAAYLLFAVGYVIVLAFSLLCSC
ncbi:hypothetical protein V8F06_014715 [Rhypophila decipiens]